MHITLPWQADISLLSWLVCRQLRDVYAERRSTPTPPPTSSPVNSICGWAYVWTWIDTRYTHTQTRRHISHTTLTTQAFLNPSPSPSSLQNGRCGRGAPVGCVRPGAWAVTPTIP